MKNLFSIFFPIYVGIDFGTYKSAISYFFGYQEPKIVVLNKKQNDPYKQCILRTRIMLELNNGNLQVEPDFGRFEKYPVKENSYLVSNFKMYIGEELNDHDEIKNKINRDISSIGLAAKILDTLRNEILHQIRISNILPHQYSWVINVPPGWNYNKRRATLFAAHIAGIQNPILIEEPLAAAAYLKSKGIFNPRKSLMTLFIDFGAGTCDLALLKTNGLQLDVIDTGTYPYGGINIDRELLKKCVEIPENMNNGYTLSPDLTNIYKNNELLSGWIYEAIMESIIEIKHKAGGLSLPRGSSLEIYIEPNEFSELIKRELIPLFEYIHGFLNNYPFEAKQISDVFLVGGSSKLSNFKAIIESVIRDYSDNFVIHSPNDPEWSVVKGAAIIAKNPQQPPFNIKCKKSLRLSYDKNILEVVGGKLPIETLKEIPSSGYIFFKLRKETSNITFEVLSEDQNEPVDIIVIKPLYSNTFPQFTRIRLIYEIGVDGLMRFNIKTIPKHSISCSFQKYDLYQDVSIIKEEYKIVGD